VIQGYIIFSVLFFAETIKFKLKIGLKQLKRYYFVTFKELNHEISFEKKFIFVETLYTLQHVITVPQCQFQHKPLQQA